jgi:flagellar basal-body rod protein FlgG
MVAQQRKHDTVTNNMANVNTPGFKQGTGISRSFPEMLIERIRSGGGVNEPITAKVGRLTTGVMAEENVSVHAQGDIQETQNPYDFALISNIQLPGAVFDASGKYVDPNGTRIIQPQAFFTVMTADDQLRYSLNGKFSVDVDGSLINSEGRRVVGRDGQPIVLLDEASGAPITNFRITKAGGFTDIDGRPILKANGEQMGMLITRIEDPNRLVKEGSGLFRMNEDAQEMVNPINADDEVEVKQGYIERSNVDASQSMIDMMTALRAYEANQKVIQFYDKSMEKAVNEVGRV